MDGAVTQVADESFSLMLSRRPLTALLRTFPYSDDGRKPGVHTWKPPFLPSSISEPFYLPTQPSINYPRQHHRHARQRVS